MLPDSIELKHARAFFLVRAFASALDQLIESLEVDVNNQQEVAVAGLAERMLTNTQAVVMLARSGLSAEAKIVARSCAEALFKLKGICLNRERISLYSNEQLFFRRRALIAITTELKGSFSDAELMEATGSLVKIEALIKSESAKDEKIWEWAKAADSSALYRSLYMLYSSYVHASSESLENWLRLNSSGDLIELVRGPTEFDLSDVLLAIASCIESAVSAISDLFDVSQSADVCGLSEGLKAAYCE